MWFALYAFVLARLWIISFLWSPFHIFFAISMAYGLFYMFRSSHRDGTLQIKWVRGWSIWDSLRTRYFRHTWHQGTAWSNFDRRGEAYLFILHPRMYGVAPFVCFALHGKQVPSISRLAPLVAAPSFFFKVPLLCDLLQTCGCITESDEAIEDSIYHNTSVVWTPPHRYASEGDVEAQLEDGVSTETCEWLVKLAASMQNRFNIVPVHVTGEEGAYYDATPVALRGAFPSSHGYRFPSFLFGLFGGPLPRRCHLRTFVGEPISSVKGLFDASGASIGTMAKNADEIGADLRNSFQRLIATGQAVGKGK